MPPGFRFSRCPCWWISALVLHFIPSSDPFPHSVAHSAAHGHDMEANMLQYLLTYPSAPVPGSEGRALPANHSEGQTLTTFSNSSSLREHAEQEGSSRVL